MIFWLMHCFFMFLFRCFCYYMKGLFWLLHCLYFGLKLRTNPFQCFLVVQSVCRLENTLNYGLERVWAIGYLKSSRR